MLNTPKKLITLKEVIALTGLSRSTIYKYISTREFPQQIPIGERSVRWRDPILDSKTDRVALRVLRGELVPLYTQLSSRLSVDN